MLLEEERRRDEARPSASSSQSGTPTTFTSQGTFVTSGGEKQPVVASPVVGGAVQAAGAIGRVANVEDENSSDRDGVERDEQPSVAQGKEATATRLFAPTDDMASKSMGRGRDAGREQSNQMRDYCSVGRRRPSFERGSRQHSPPRRLWAWLIGKQRAHRDREDHIRRRDATTEQRGSVYKERATARGFWGKILKLSRRSHDRIRGRPRESGVETSQQGESSKRESHNL